MAHFINWRLSGLNAQGRALPHDPVFRAFSALDCMDELWASKDPDEEIIIEFSTWSRSAYETVVDAAVSASKRFPDAVLCLECRNEDEGWHQKILLQNGETETLEGYIAYPKPERIFYPPTK